jgi:hypothetical protein
MSSIQTPDIAQQLLAYLSEDVECRALAQADGGRVGCLTPLEYPGGDNVVVWITRHDAMFEVSEHGEAVNDAPDMGRDHRAFNEFAGQLARVQGCTFASGQVVTRCEQAALGEHVWRVGVAAAQIAQLAKASKVFHRGQPAKERDFVHVVEHALTARNLSVEREHKIEGKSGHRHRATIYLPESETVLEPVGGHWGQATGAYVKLGDIRNVNGYQLYSLLDDRAGGADEDAANLLAQVSSVVQWTRRDEWLSLVG